MSEPSNTSERFIDVDGGKYNVTVTITNNKEITQNTQEDAPSTQNNNPAQNFKLYESLTSNDEEGNNDSYKTQTFKKLATYNPIVSKTQPLVLNKHLTEMPLSPKKGYDFEISDEDFIEKLFSGVPLDAIAGSTYKLKL